MDAMMMDEMSKGMSDMPAMMDMDMELMQACMDACAACEQACTICAAQGMDCAAACMNCADMCNTMMRAMMRMQGVTPPVMMAMLDACIMMTQLCQDTCLEHEDSTVCKMCADACMACMEACVALKNSMAG